MESRSVSDVTVPGSSSTQTRSNTSSSRSKKGSVVDSSSFMQEDDDDGRLGVVQKPLHVGNPVDTTNTTIQDPMMEDDVESQFRQSKEKQQQVDSAWVDMGSPTGIVHKSPFSRRKARACCLCLALSLFFLFLATNAFRQQTPPVNTACDAQLSKPSAKNRTVSRDLCVTHELLQWKNGAIQAFLSPPEQLNEPAVKFLVIGDFGRDGFCCQRDVAIEMERVADQIGAGFVVNTGDTFYDSGIMTPNDEQVKTSFLNVYNTPALKQLEFHSVLGNRDYQGSATAILGLNEKHSRFTMEGRFWAKAFVTKDLAVQFLFIDTSPMIESYKDPKYENNDGIMLKRTDGVSTQWSKVDEQLEWIQGRLENQKHDYNMRIVVGHHPLYGYTVHVGENRTTLQTRLGPLLEKYNVTAMFSGHSHFLQLAKPQGTAHFVSGAGSKIARGKLVGDTPESAVRFYYVEQGFLACSIYKNELRVGVVNIKGELLDSVVLKSRG